MSDYNYATFDLAREEPSFLAFPGHLTVGECAPDATLEDLSTAEPVSLRRLATTGIAVLEFGSFT